jgi:hypothetical protein
MRKEEDNMIHDTVLGALYLSAVDMILLIAFLYILGLVFRLFPLFNKITFSKRKGQNNDNN